MSTIIQKNSTIFRIFLTCICLLHTSTPTHVPTRIDKRIKNVCNFQEIILWRFNTLVDLEKTIKKNPKRNHICSKPFLSETTSDDHPYRDAYFSGFFSSLRASRNPLEERRIIDDKNFIQKGYPRICLDTYVILERLYTSFDQKSSTRSSILFNNIYMKFSLHFCALPSRWLQALHAYIIFRAIPLGYKKIINLFRNK